MKIRLSRLILSVGLVLVLLICFQFVSARTKTNPTTVRDYYLLLPAEYLTVLESVKNRRSIIKTQDLKNGYLRLESADWEGWAEIALFRKKSREAVIAVEYVGCGPACDGAVQFVSYKNGEWTDVTAQVMPDIEDVDILAAYNRIKTKDDDAHTLDDLPLTYWALPQKGTTLKLLVGDESASSGKTLLSFVWNGERFVKATK